MRRRSWFRLHQWVGLCAAIVLVSSVVTGLVLVFRAELSPARPVAPLVEHPISIEAIVAKAVAHGDGSPATDLSLPLKPQQPYTVWLDDDAETEVYLAGDGRVLGSREGASGLLRVLFQLHTGELFGPVGTLLMLLAGVGLLLLIVSGLSMLWARMVARRARIARKAAKVVDR